MGVIALLLLIGIALTLCACAGATPKKMKENIAVQYPATSYLTAVGIGNSEQDAKNKAVAELSRIFESKVASDTMDRLSFVSKSSNDQSIVQTVKSQIRITSGVRLQAVQTPMDWEFEKRYYALAALDKKKAKEAWLGEINALDEKISAVSESLGSIQGNILRYRALKAIVRLSVERETLSGRLRVLGFGDDIPEGYGIKKPLSELLSIKASMLFAVVVRGEFAGTIRQNLSESLARNGFVFTPMDKDAEILIEGSVDVTPVEIDDPELKFARAAVSLKITDVRNQILLGEIIVQERGAHMVYDEAIGKAMWKTMPGVVKKLYEIIEGSGTDINIEPEGEPAK